MGYILAIDQGTTGTTAALIEDKSFTFIDKVNHEYPQIYPEPGQVEHNLNDIWKSVETTVSEVLKNNKVEPTDISSIGITNQRETTCPFDNQGNPLAHAIVWQDRRTADFCEELKGKGHEKTFKVKTGLPLDSYFSGTKMNWLLNNNENIKKASKENNLKFGTIDTFLIYKLTNSKSFSTEASNASRTLLMDLKTSSWDDQLLDILGVKKDYLPEIKNSFDNFGVTEGLNFLPDGIPITGVLGDQQSALFGQAGYKKGSIKCTYGTGAFVLLNTGEDLLTSSNGLLTTVAYRKNGKNYYAFEGSSYIAGAAVQWLRDNLKIISNAAEIESLANEVKNIDDVKNIYFFPFFSGIGTPYWNAHAKAAIVGLTRDSGRPHIARACLEGICLSINDLINAMKKDAGFNLEELKVDGGAVVNNLLMEMQATISDLKLIRPKVIETTAYGAALASALGNKKITFSEIDDLWKKDRDFTADNKTKEYYDKKSEGWTKGVQTYFLNK
jgi:glycerol kinase